MPQPSVATRRQMLATAAFSVVTASGIYRANAMNEPQNSTDNDAHPWIDAHSHIWSTDLKKYPLRNNQTVEALAPRSFTDEELLAFAMPQGVGRVVLIQHYPHHGYDNSYLIDTWRKHQDRFRIVGQIDSDRPDVAKTMRDMLKTGVTGFRIGPQSKDDDWLAGEGMKTMWKTAACGESRRLFAGTPSCFRAYTRS